jgi:hypothetical protein
MGEVGENNLFWQLFTPSTKKNKTDADRAVKKM